MNKRVVICQIYDLSNNEVVYLDDGGRAINEDMTLHNEKWEFKNKGASGGYADNYPRLSSYVAILKNKNR